MLSTINRCKFCGRRCTGEFCDAECAMGIKISPTYARYTENWPPRTVASEIDAPVAIIAVHVHESLRE